MIVSSFIAEWTGSDAVVPAGSERFRSPFTRTGLASNVRRLAVKHWYLLRL